MVAANVTLGGIPLNANPEDIHWTFKVKTANAEMMGGRVIQVLGATLGDITIMGHFGLDEKTDTEAWQSEARFQHQVRVWAQQAIDTSNKNALRFTYAPRQWDFQVFIREVSPVSQRLEQVAPQWSLTLVPVDQAAFQVVQDVKDLYIKRLMDGVGWKQSDYNGPQQADVETTLSGLSIQDWVEKQYGDAYTYGYVPGVGGANGGQPTP